MRRNFLLGTLGVALVLSLVWGFNERGKAQDLKITTENQYHRSFDDLATQLDGLETALAKSKVAGTPTQKVYYLSQTWQQSNTAVKDLSMLPAKEVGLSYVDQLLNQIGEYTQTLTRKVAYGGTLDEKEEKLLEDMHNRVIDVNNKVQDLYVSVNTESLAWLDKEPSWSERLGFGKTRVAEAAAEGEEAKPGSVRSGLDQLNASLQKLPPFTYEGQTDTHSVPEPLGLPDRKIDQAQSKVVAETFLHKLGVPSSDLQSAGAIQGPMGGFVWQKDQISVDVSKQGGVVTLFRNDREIGERKLSKEQAQEEGLKNLQKLGWKMVITSNEDFGGYSQLEAVPEVSGIRLYPDKIRFIVANDNGQIIGYDATPYYAFHHERKFNKKLSVEQAKAKLKSGFKIKESRLAVIPKEGRAEAFSYEFRGTYKGEDYLVYINAENGIEEKIQRVIKTPRGEYLQ